MGAWQWLSQNWFDLSTTLGVLASLGFTAATLRSEARIHAVANLISLTRNQREIWRDFCWQPGLARILDEKADVTATPVSPEEEVFVIALIQHAHASYQAMRNGLAIKPEGFQADVRSLFALPVPNAVWRRAKPLQDRDFAEFVEAALK